MPHHEIDGIARAEIDLSKLSLKDASLVVEQVSQSEFDQSGVVGAPLLHMRETNPRQYAPILKTTKPEEDPALHNLKLVEQVGDVCSDLKNGNLAKLKDALESYNSSKEFKDEDFALNEIIRQAELSGLLARPGTNPDGTMGLILHKPGSPFGIDIDNDKDTVYDWQTKEDVSSVSPEQTLAVWAQSGVSSDVGLRDEAAQMLKQFGAGDALTPIPDDLESYFNVVYANGYAGKKGFDAMEALSSDLTNQLSQDRISILVKQDSEYPNSAICKISTANRTINDAGWSIDY